MAKRIELSIPRRCHEKWSAFVETDRGGFCDSCKKEVIDFTTWSDEQLMNHFKSKPANVCGRFHGHQLKTYTPEQHKTLFNHLVSTFLAGIMLIASREGSAQITGQRAGIEYAKPDSATSKGSEVPKVSTHVIPERLTSTDTATDLQIVKYNFDTGIRHDLNGSQKNIECLLRGRMGGVVYRRPWYNPTRWRNDIIDWLRY